MKQADVDVIALICHALSSAIVLKVPVVKIDGQKKLMTLVIQMQVKVIVMTTINCIIYIQHLPRQVYH